MSGTVCFTSCTLAYLSRARVLAATVRAAHPDWAMHVLLVDALPDDADLAGFDAVTLADTLAISRFRAWMFKHDLVEACTAVKGAMLARLLAAGAERVVYLDPDIAVFHPLAALDGACADASIVLTPHQIDANTTSRAVQDNEMASLRYGIYNLGFVAVRNDDAGRAFADWWSLATQTACYDDTGNGIFTDQRYCDLVPTLFDNVRILRDPGYNVASWNLSRRDLAVTAAGDITANGALLRFYHFTKIGSVGDVMIERYARDNMPAYELLAWYKRQIAAHRTEALDGQPWCYGAFDDGTPVPRGVRLLWRERADLYAAHDDPFATGAGSLHAWLTRERPDLLEE